MKSKGISLNTMAGYYDLLTPAEKSPLRQKQIALIALKEGESVLEVGCGTGILSVLAKLAVGEKGKVTGTDIAEKMIHKAKTKAIKYKLNIDFRIASIDQLPFPDKHFDVILSSMMFHHLPLAIKKTGLTELHRILKDDGRILLSDFGKPTFYGAPLIFLLLIWIEPTRFQLLGKLPALISDSGFKYIKLLKKGSFIRHYLIKK